MNSMSSIGIGFQFILAEAWDVMDLVNKFVNIDSIYELGWVAFSLSLLIFGVMYVAGGFASTLAKKLRIAYILGGIMIIAAIPIIGEWVKPAFKAISN